MDVNELRILVTLLSFGCFLGITVWAWSRSNREGFDEAAQLPFSGEAAPLASDPSSNGTMP